MRSYTYKLSYCILSWWFIYNFNCTFFKKKLTHTFVPDAAKCREISARSENFPEPIQIWKYVLIIIYLTVWICHMKYPQFYNSSTIFGSFIFQLRLRRILIALPSPPSDNIPFCNIFFVIFVLSLIVCWTQVTATKCKTSRMFTSMDWSKKVPISDWKCMYRMNQYDGISGKAWYETILPNARQWVLINFHLESSCFMAATTTNSCYCLF